VKAGYNGRLYPETLLNKGDSVNRSLLYFVSILLSSLPLAAGATEDVGLYKAAGACDLDLGTLLLKRGADPNRLFDSQSIKGGHRTALMAAVAADWPVETVQKKCVPLVEALLAAGANPNLEDEDGTSSMLLAAAWDIRPEIMAALLEHDGNPNIQQHSKKVKRVALPPNLDSEGTTPLMIMASDWRVEHALFAESDTFNHDLVVRKLQVLGKRADPNVHDAHGRTALMFASKFGHKFVVQELLGFRADPNLRDEKKHTALDYAIQNAQTEVVKILQDVTTK
jgi:ankyrin repeat protein